MSTNDPPPDKHSTFIVTTDDPTDPNHRSFEYYEATDPDDAQRQFLAEYPHLERRIVSIHEETQLSELEHDELIAVAEWLATQLNEWMTSEIVESGYGHTKTRTPEQLISDAITATR